MVDFPRSGRPLMSPALISPAVALAVAPPGPPAAFYGPPPPASSGDCPTARLPAARLVEPLGKAVLLADGLHQSVDLAPDPGVADPVEGLDQLEGVVPAEQVANALFGGRTRRRGACSLASLGLRRQLLEAIGDRHPQPPGEVEEAD